MSTWSSRAAKRRPNSRGRTIRIRAPRITKASGGWAVFTAAFSLAAITVQTTGLIVTALIGLTGTIVTAMAGPRVAVTHRRASTERKPSPGGKRKPRRSPAPAGTGRRPKCSVRCQRSKQPADTCDCVCGGKTHGPARAAGAQVSRAQIKSRPMKKQAAQQRRTT